MGSKKNPISNRVLAFSLKNSLWTLTPPLMWLNLHRFGSLFDLSLLNIEIWKLSICWRIRLVFLLNLIFVPLSLVISLFESAFLWIYQIIFHENSFFILSLSLTHSSFFRKSHIKWIGTLIGWVTSQRYVYLVLKILSGCVKMHPQMPGYVLWQERWIAFQNLILLHLTLVLIFWVLPSPLLLHCSISLSRVCRYPFKALLGVCVLLCLCFSTTFPPHVSFASLKL